MEVKAINDFVGKMNEYHSINFEMRVSALEVLTNLLRENNNEITNDDERELLNGIAITYDGGNHPEYASCVISTILAIRINDDGAIFFDLEDESNVLSDRITTDDLVYVVEQLINV